MMPVDNNDNVRNAYLNCQQPPEGFSGAVLTHAVKTFTI